MAPLSGGPTRTLPAKWRRYPAARLERYLQNGAIIRMAGFTHRPLPKNRKNNFFSYNIYGFAINRIYKKNSTISAFRWESRSSRIYFLNVDTKAVASDSKKVNGAPIAASFVAAKRSYSRHFAWSRRHKFSYLWNFDQSWSLPAMFLTSVTCRLSNLRKPPSAAARALVAIV